LQALNTGPATVLVSSTVCGFAAMAASTASLHVASALSKPARSSQIAGAAVEGLERRHDDSGIEILLALEHLADRLCGIADAFHELMTLVEWIIASDER
jgi:hypothetical protein